MSDSGGYRPVTALGVLREKARRVGAGRAALVALLLALGVAAAAPAPALASSSSLVVSQVYGGGGNSGAPYTNDFVEIFNRGTVTVSLAGMSVQYASATGRKVILASTTSGLACNGSVGQPCSAAQVAQIVDLVGYDGANFFEGASAASTLSNTTAALRNDSGCTDTDNNGADFTAGPPAPRNAISPLHFCLGDQPPSIVSRSPAGGATGIAANANVTITFSEPVNVGGSWFSISCGTSGTHTAAVSGGPTAFTLDPDADFAQGETCTVTVVGSQVSDKETSDPPDTMAGDDT